MKQKHRSQARAISQHLDALLANIDSHSQRDATQNQIKLWATEATKLYQRVLVIQQGVKELMDDDKATFKARLGTEEEHGDLVAAARALDAAIKKIPSLAPDSNHAQKSRVRAAVLSDLSDCATYLAQV